MANSRAEQPVIPSFLDRLLDDQADNELDRLRSKGQLLKSLKQSVRRDLENVLNTRWRCKSWPPGLDELELSIVNYGIPDFAGVKMSLPSEREHVRQVLERAIRKFEPRFTRVSVTLLANKDEFDRTLRLRIEALLRAEPAPEPVVFDSELEPGSGVIVVGGVSR